MPIVWVNWAFVEKHHHKILPGKKDPVTTTENNDFCFLLLEATYSLSHVEPGHVFQGRYFLSLII